MGHLLVTNDFPPKTGGIQTYLWELWSRLPQGESTVFTTAYEDTERFDSQAPMNIVRANERVLLPTPSTIRMIRHLAGESKARIVVLDPALPIGLAGRHLGMPYVTILHGAEVTVPARLPLTRQLMRISLGRAKGLIAAGGYPRQEVERLLQGGTVPPIRIVMPGVDTKRFVPLEDPIKRQARRSFGIADDAELVLSVSRLVPRKGMDTLIKAASLLKERRPKLIVAIGGAGRDRDRLERMSTTERAPVRFLGKVPDERLATLYGCADVFVMACRDRWAGLEQEGFGVVFLEAASCGVPQIAGRSGGSHEAVADQVTGYILKEPDDPVALAGRIEGLLESPGLRLEMGKAARLRSTRLFGYDHLAGVLLDSLVEFESSI
ncbi:MAG TPA: glycosyltransferase family 4 protein [Acidimicrobiales bacterium]|nr:glycosyltransferase family 4 protein [Acidimicrobiales bacterium]